MTRPELVRRAYKWFLVSVGVACLLLWIVGEAWSSSLASTGSIVVVVLLVAALPVGLYLEKYPEEIERTGDPLFDDEIDRVLRERAPKKKR